MFPQSESSVVEPQPKGWYSYDPLPAHHQQCQLSIHNQNGELPFIPRRRCRRRRRLRVPRFPRSSGRYSSADNLMIRDALGAQDRTI